MDREGWSTESAVEGASGAGHLEGLLGDLLGQLRSPDGRAHFEALVHAEGANVLGTACTGAKAEGLEVRADGTGTKAEGAEREAALRVERAAVATEGGGMEGLLASLGHDLAELRAEENAP